MTTDTGSTLADTEDAPCPHLRYIDVTPHGDPDKEWMCDECGHFRVGPSVTLHEDGHHFWWQHVCTPRDVSHLDADTAAAVQELEAQPTMLPLGQDKWQLVQADPLTISPSILCGECGIHGFWTNGAWVSV